MTGKLPDTLRNATRGRPLYVLGETYAIAKDWAHRHALKSSEWVFVPPGKPMMKGIRNVPIVVVGRVRPEHVAEVRLCNVIFNEYGIII